MARRQPKRINVERVMFPRECFLRTLAIPRRVLINEINSNLVAEASCWLRSNDQQFSKRFSRGGYTQNIHVKIKTVLCVLSDRR